MALLSGFLLALCIFSLHVEAETSFFPEFPIPVFFWGSQDTFVATTNQYIETIAMQKVSEFIISFGEVKTRPNNPLSLFRTSDAPELILLWIEKNEDHAFHHIEPLIESAGSSLIVVNSYRQNGASINDSIAKMGWKYVPAEDLAVYMQEHKDIISNNSPDFLVVVGIEKYSLSERGALLKSVDAQLKELNAKYVCIVTAVTSVNVEQRVASIQSQLNLMQHNSPVFTYAESKYWPQGVWEGLLVAALLIILLLLGVGCTASVQTPSRWELPTHPRCQFTELNEP